MLAFGHGQIVSMRVTNQPAVSDEACLPLRWLQMYVQIWLLFIIIFSYFEGFPSIKGKGGQGSRLLRLQACNLASPADSESLIL